MWFRYCPEVGAAYNSGPSAESDKKDFEDVIDMSGVWETLLQKLETLATWECEGGIEKKLNRVKNSEASGLPLSFRLSDIIPIPKTLSDKLQLSGVKIGEDFAATSPVGEATEKQRSERRHAKVDPILKERQIPSVYRWERNAGVTENLARNYMRETTKKLSMDSAVKLAAAIGLAPEELS